MKVNERRTVVGVDWPLCVPQPWREIDADAYGTYGRTDGRASRAAVGMGIPMGIPIGMGMVWVWGL